ncbi:MAG: ABC transporter substrate-binding protein [Verrucomicrobiota bacterium]
MKHLFVTALLLVCPVALNASDNSAAETRLKSSIDQVVTIAKNASDRSTLIAHVKPVLEHILSFETMTRRAVGPGWREFTPDQQAEAVRLFTTLILRTYTAKFTPGEYPSVIYKTATSPSPGRVEIPTTAMYRGSRYEVVYRLEEKDGWTITDIVIEGVSMVASYRTQFDEEYKQGGAVAVLASLHRAVSESK